MEVVKIEIEIMYVDRLAEAYLLLVNEYPNMAFDIKTEEERRRNLAATLQGEGGEISRRARAFRHYAWILEEARIDDGHVSAVTAQSHEVDEYVLWLRGHLRTFQNRDQNPTPVEQYAREYQIAMNSIPHTARSKSRSWWRKKRICDLYFVPAAELSKLPSFYVMWDRALQANRMIMEIEEALVEAEKNVALYVRERKRIQGKMIPEEDSKENMDS